MYINLAQLIINNNKFSITHKSKKNTNIKTWFLNKSINKTNFDLKIYTYKNIKKKDLNSK